MYSVVWGKGGGGRDPILGCQTTTNSPPYPPPPPQYPIWGTGTKVGNSRAAVTLSLSPERYAGCIRGISAYRYTCPKNPRYASMYNVCTVRIYTCTSNCYSSWSIYPYIPYAYRCVFTSSAVKLCNNKHRAMTSDLIHILISEIENMRLNMSYIV